MSNPVLEKAVRNDIMGDLLSALMQHGSMVHPQAFGMAEGLVEAYQNKIGRQLSDLEKWDFRRGVEIGFYFGAEARAVAGDVAEGVPVVVGVRKEGVIK